MRSAAISLTLLTLAGTVHAGVYNLAEVHPAVPLEEIRAYVLKVRSAAVPTKGTPLPESFKAQVLRQVQELEQLRSSGLLSTRDRVNLSACYLRLGGDHLGDALRLLNAGDQSDFLIQSNLAAAYFLSGELRMAIRHQERALALWPEVFAGWTEKQWRHYRDAELLLQRLYRLRFEESLRGPPRGEVGVDALFPGVRFVGSSGEYEAGGLALEMRDRLPGDALNLVFRLQIWLPTDTRLYWLLGELLNSVGAVDQARDICVELVEAGALFRDLRRHRAVLNDAVGAFRAIRQPSTQGLLISTLMLLPQSPFAPPGIGAAAEVAGTGAAAVYAPHAGKLEIPTFPGTPASETQELAQPLPFNFRHVTVGFGFGFLVAALLGFQWQEWRRRRLHGARATLSDSEGPASVGPSRSTSD